MNFSCKMKKKRVRYTQKDRGCLLQKKIRMMRWKNGAF